MFKLILVLAINLAISVLNCYAAGVSWKDVFTRGSRLDRWVLRSAVFQSGVGFSMPILLGLGIGTVSYLTSGTEPALSAEEGKQMMEAIVNLWYAIVIIPILGTGTIIWIYSLRVAYERRDLSSIATAGWNTYANVSNAMDAVNNIGGVLGKLGSFFGDALNSKGDGKAKSGLIVLLIVAVSLMLGFIIAISLVRYFARTAVARVEAQRA